MSGNLALYTGGWSKHFDEAEDNIYVDEFNENHKLLGVQYEGFIVGQFYNSYNHKNYLFGYALENKHLLFINGFATNYKRDSCPTIKKAGLCYMPMMFVKVQKTPMIVGVMKNGLILSLKWDLGF